MPSGKSKWYSATIRGVHADGTFDIEFADKRFGKEHDVKKASLRGASSASSSSDDDDDDDGDDSGSKKSSGSRRATKAKKADGKTHTHVGLKELKKLKSRFDGDGHGGHEWEDRIHIGSHVEITVGVQTGGLKQMDGEVCWVHRDGKFVVRTGEDVNGKGSGRLVHDGLSPGVVRLPGKQMGTAPMTSMELAQFGAGFALEMLAYSWFAFGALVEQFEGWSAHAQAGPEYLRDPLFMATQTKPACLLSAGKAALLPPRTVPSNATFMLVPGEDLIASRGWLAFLLVVNAAGLALFALACYRFALRKASVLQAGTLELTDVHAEMAFRRRMLQAQIVMVNASLLTLVCYGTFLNACRFYCIWGDGGAAGGEGGEDDVRAFRANPFETRHVYGTFGETVQALMSTVAFNSFRATFLFLVLEGGHTLVQRALLVVPAAGATAIIMAKAVAAVEVLHYVQRVRSEQRGGLLSMDYETDTAAANLFFSFWLNATIISCALMFKSHQMMGREHELRGGELETGALEAAMAGDFGKLAQVSKGSPPMSSPPQFTTPSFQSVCFTERVYVCCSILPAKPHGCVL
jgi:hypothetical protein